jgi:hypothetical protein
LKYGAIDKKPEIKIDTNLNSREVYNIQQSGNDSSDFFVNAKLAREIIGLAILEIDLEKSLPILNLVKVGEPVKVRCRTLEYTPLSGKYILKSSDLVFTRETADWTSTCHLTLMRTNQYI